VPITKAKAAIDSLAASIDSGSRREDKQIEPVFVDQVGANVVTFSLQKWQKILPVGSKNITCWFQKNYLLGLKILQFMHKHVIFRMMPIGEKTLTLVIVQLTPFVQNVYIKPSQAALKIPGNEKKLPKNGNTFFPKIHIMSESGQKLT
jgi:hypothetical protein